MSHVNLGDKVKDVISNITGIATCKQESLSGCVQFLVETKMNKEGTSRDFWLDEQRLEILKKNVFKEQPSSAKTGGMKKEAQTK